MNQTLLGIGVGLVLLLFAALLVPFFIDWSSYRDYVESRAGEIFGRKVEIVGDPALAVIELDEKHRAVLFPLDVPALFQGIVLNSKTENAEKIKHVAKTKKVRKKRVRKRIAKRKTIKKTKPKVQFFPEDF